MPLIRRRSDSPSRQHEQDRSPLAELRDEMDRMRDEMNRIFDRFARPDGELEIGKLGAFTPRLDVHETDDHIRVTAELPGLEADDIDISVDGDHLTLRGEKHSEEHHEDANGVRTERRYGRFRRDVTLPTRVDEARCEASFRNGVLELTLPKTSPGRHKGRRIPVKS